MSGFLSYYFDAVIPKWQRRIIEMGRITLQTINSMFQDLSPFGRFNHEYEFIKKNGKIYFKFKDEESAQENFYNFLEALEREKKTLIENLRFEFKGHVPSIQNMIRNYRISDKVNLYNQNQILEKIGSVYGVPVNLITIRQNRYKVIDTNGFLLGEGPSKSIALSDGFRTIEIIADFEQLKSPKKPDAKIFWRRDVSEDLTKDWKNRLRMYDRFQSYRFFEMIDIFCSNYVDIRKNSYGNYFLIDLDCNENIFEGTDNLKETAMQFLQEFEKFQQSVVENNSRSDIEELRTDKKIIKEMINDFKRTYNVCVTLSFSKDRAKLKLIEK